MTAASSALPGPIARQSAPTRSGTASRVLEKLAARSPTRLRGTSRVRTEEEIRMATARLRVFPQPDDEVVEEFHSPHVPIRLSDLYPLLAQAHRDNFVWLRDFENDEIMVSSDLFEVVRAFSDMRPSA